MRLGSGQLDLRGFLQSLSESSYTGYVSMETLSEEDTAHSWQILLDTETQLFGEDFIRASSVNRINGRENIKKRLSKEQNSTRLVEI